MEKLILFVKNDCNKIGKNKKKDWEKKETSKIGKGAHRRECSRRKTVNLFGQAAWLSEDTGILKEKSRFGYKINFNIGDFCVYRGMPGEVSKGTHLTCHVLMLYKECIPVAFAVYNQF